MDPGPLPNKRPSFMRQYSILVSVKPRARLSASNPISPDSKSSEFIPISLFQHLPAQKPRPINRDATTAVRSNDYRFGPIRIDWVDFETMIKPSTHGVVQKDLHSKTRGASHPHDLLDDVAHNHRARDCHVRAAYTDEVWFYELARGHCSHLPTVTQ